MLSLLHAVCLKVRDFLVQMWSVTCCRQHANLAVTLSGHASWVLIVAFSPDKQHFVSSCSDQTVKVWELRSRQCIHTFNEHTDQVTYCVFIPKFFRMVM